MSGIENCAGSNRLCFGALRRSGAYWHAAPVVDQWLNGQSLSSLGFAELCCDIAAAGRAAKNRITIKVLIITRLKNYRLFNRH